MRMLREWIHRLLGTLRIARRDDDLADELRLHLELAAEDAGRRGDEPAAAVRAARLQNGNASHAMDALRDQRGFPWLDAVTADVVFGWRQLHKHRATSIAVILSLGLAIGSTAAAFRLIDAVLLRPLPVADPHRLFFVTTTFIDNNNTPDYNEHFDYPTFQRYSATAAALAETMVVGMTARLSGEITAGEPEPLYRQYVSGNVFGSFGLQPALGRLIGPSDDVQPGGHPVAVLSHDYWARRFGRDPGVAGRTVRLGARPYEIIGVAPRGFTGTEPGRITDIFIPSVMNAEALTSPGWAWFRMWMRPKPGVEAEQVRQALQTVFTQEHRDHLSSFPPETPQHRIDAYLSEQVLLLPAGSGASVAQKSFRRPLVILAALVALVLLIACTNVANLLTAQAIGRAREMALRVSIGAGRGRLVQLVLVECALLAILASAAGALFAWWAAPFVVSMLATPEDPIRLVLGADWRTLGFGIVLILFVIGTFGLAPALRASAVKPITAIKEHSDRHARRGLTHGLIGAQMALCVFVVFVAGLFVATFERLSTRPLGFAHERVIVVDVETRGKPQDPAGWERLGDTIRQTPGVEKVAFAAWTLLSENRWRASVRVAGGEFGEQAPYFLEVNPGFFDAMTITMLDGRDFRPGDLPPEFVEKPQPRAGVGIVNEAFARQSFDGRSPVGQRVLVRQGKQTDAALEIVGLVADASYYNVREPMRPNVFVPIERRRGNGSFLVRTAGDPSALGPVIQRQLTEANPGMRARAALQSGLVRRQMVRERLLATLSIFFASLALLLAAIGLYGVLNYAVTQQRREIGLRMALGARPSHVVRRVVTEMLLTVSLGAIAGVSAGIAAGRLIEPLLFEVKAGDPVAMATPLVVLALAAAVAALPPAIRAVRVDPVEILRAE